jgi:phosphoribosylformylglycinamidine (FGAM) synthase-like enzyme
MRRDRWCFAGRVGAEIMVDSFKKDDDAIAALFNEELGAVFQVRQADVAALACIRYEVSAHCCWRAGRVEDQSRPPADAMLTAWSHCSRGQHRYLVPPHL